MNGTVWYLYCAVGLDVNNGVSLEQLTSYKLLTYYREVSNSYSNLRQKSEESSLAGRDITYEDVGDNKVRELIAVKVPHTSLLNTTVVAFKVLPLGSYAPMLASSPPFKQFWNWFCGMAFRAALVLLQMSSMSSKCLPFNISFIFGNRKKSPGTRSNK